MHTCKKCAFFTPDFLSNDGRTFAHWENIDQLRSASASCKVCAILLHHIEREKASKGSFKNNVSKEVVAAQNWGDARLSRTSLTNIVISNLPNSSAVKVQVPEPDGLTLNVNYIWDTST